MIIIIFLKHTTKFCVADKEKAQRDKGGGRILLGDNKTAVWRSYCGPSGSGVLGLDYSWFHLCMHIQCLYIYINKQWGSVCVCTDVRVQFKSQLQQTGTWSVGAIPPHSLCYHPVVLFPQLCLVAHSFERRNMQGVFYKNIINISVKMLLTIIFFLKVPNLKMPKSGIVCMPNRHNMLACI